MLILHCGIGEAVVLLLLFWIHLWERHRAPRQRRADTCVALSLGYDFDIHSSAHVWRQSAGSDLKEERWRIKFRTTSCNTYGLFKPGLCVHQTTTQACCFTSTWREQEAAVSLNTEWTFSDTHKADCSHSGGQRTAWVSTNVMTSCYCNEQIIQQNTEQGTQDGFTENKSNKRSHQRN